MFLLSCAGGARGQSNWVDVYQEYSKVVKAAEISGPLERGLFGESVSLYNGATEFSVVDIDIPGSNRLPVQLGRRLKIEARSHNSENIGGFGVWDIDIPYLYGVFDSSYKWNQAGNGATARCSQLWFPKVHFNANVVEIWSGNYIHLPGKGDQEILSLIPNTPAPIDGRGYHWTTRGDIRFTCKPTTSNGYPGEGFVAVTGDGTRITFDVGVERMAPDVDAGRKFYAGRVKVLFLASRVEDVSGNWVNYSYSGHLLTSITSSDGRRIDLAYGSKGEIVRATAHGRTWEYSYLYPDYNKAFNNLKEAILTKVTNPGGQYWEFSYSGGLIPGLYGGGSVNVGCPEPSMNGSLGFYIKIKHPSGAGGDFDFSYSRHYRSGVPDTCKAQLQGWEDLPNNFEGGGGRTHALDTTDFFDSFSIDAKRITGLGLGEMLWRYDYGAVSYGRTYGGAEVPCLSCPASKTVVVKNPDETSTHYIYGVRYHDNDGRLIETRVVNSSGEVIRSVVNTYLTDAEASSQPFRDIYGGAGAAGDDPVSYRIRPVKRVDTLEGGVKFSYSVESFDNFVRPMASTRKVELLGSPARTEATTYYDNLVKWVIGRTKRQTTNGTETTRTDYDPATALPIRQYAYGKLQQSLTYHPDGTV
ncbi:hypothetical protein, partial [Solilutibacter pythonis]|uniref:hypothetical protein n=1 Tax=Solilutibacter pythonis TaxID=2483112 RepID=UPI0011C3A2F9